MPKLFLNPLAGILLLMVLSSPKIQGNNNIVVSDSTFMKVAIFDMDVTPPVGARLTYDREINTWDLGLRAKGIVLLGAGQPIVLCSVDWIGIANEGHDAFRQALAKAAGTIPSRVAVHTVHQHDAPTCDFSSEKLLKRKGLKTMGYNGAFPRKVISQLAEEVKKSLASAQPVTHIGLGEAEVYQVASNRRICKSDGTFIATRWTTCKDSALRAEPEGLVDPMVSLVSLWNGDQPIVVLSYYAVHPQSYYRTGIANPDFPGVARFMRQMAVPSAFHIHFNGAGGDISAGKYNDGSHENRLVLAERLADGMKRAWESTRYEPVKPKDMDWTVEPVALPPAKELQEKGTDWMKTADSTFLTNNVYKTAWLHRLKKGMKIDISCLKLGNARILHLPGEPFVAYQLSAKAMCPDQFVAVAAYGDYAPGYIGTEESYRQGGYETGPASGVAPEAEYVIMDALRKLLHHDKLM